MDASPEPQLQLQHEVVAAVALVDELARAAALARCWGTPLLGGEGGSWGEGRKGGRGGKEGREGKGGSPGGRDEDGWWNDEVNNEGTDEGLLTSQTGLL